MSLKKINNKFWWVIEELFKNKHFHVIFPQQQWPPQCLWISMMMFRPLYTRAAHSHRYYPSRTLSPVAHVKMAVWQPRTGNNREGRTAGERSGPATADDNNKTTWQGPVARLAPERMTYIQPLAKWRAERVVGGAGERSSVPCCCCVAGGGGGGFSVALVVVTESPSASKAIVACSVCMGMWIFRWDGFFFYRVRSAVLLFGRVCNVSLCFKESIEAIMSWEQKISDD